jgi:hypothetical protein
VLHNFVYVMYVTGDGSQLCADGFSRSDSVALEVFVFIY